MCASLDVRSEVNFLATPHETVTAGEPDEPLRPLFSAVGTA